MCEIVYVVGFVRLLVLVFCVCFWCCFVVYVGEYRKCFLSGYVLNGVVLGEKMVNMLVIC